MTRLKLLSAAALLSALAVGQLVEARTHHALTRCPTRSLQPQLRAGALPGSFAYYDGPSTNACAQSAATYLGQDHRGTPALKGEFRSDGFRRSPSPLSSVFGYHLRIQNFAGQQRLTDQQNIGARSES